MAGDNLELDNLGGQFQLAVGALFLDTDVRRMGEMNLRTLKNFLALLFYDEAGLTPQNGVAGELSTSTHLLPSKGAGDLDVDVAAGFGMAFDSAELAADEFEQTSYRPAVLEADTTVTSVAHDATNPRIDLVIATPAEVDDEDTARQTRAPGSSQLTNPVPTVPLRQRFSATISIVTGTPEADPKRPNVPEGSILLGRVDVPATSGAVTVTDERTFLQIGSALRGVPPVRLVEDHVRGATDNLQLSHDPGAPSHDTSLNGGYATVEGRERYYISQLVTHSVPAALSRLDRVYADADGSIKVTEGLEGNPPIEPSASPGAALGLVQVDVGSVNTGTPVVDQREAGHIGPDQLRVDAVESTHLADAAVEQDSIASDSRTIAVAGSSFRPGSLNEANRGFSTESGQFVPGVGSISSYFISAPIQLPTGAVVTSVQLHVRATGAGGGTTFMGKLQSVSFTADASTLHAEAAGATVASTSSTFTQATINDPVVDVSDKAYFLEIEFDTPASDFSEDRIHGMSVTFATNQHLS